MPAYEVTAPYGTAAVAWSTARWNGLRASRRPSGHSSRLRRRSAPHAHGALDRAVADKVLAAACARARVRLDARRRRAVRVADGGGDERRLDLLAHGRLARHLSSLPSGSSYPLRLRRILRRAWNTWARALSGEQSRLRPMAS